MIDNAIRGAMLQFGFSCEDIQEAMRFLGTENPYQAGRWLKDREQALANGCPPELLE